ncbi:fatty acid desaturase family protein [Herbaspirillum lusitanum]|uniref:Fatty acid desaturase family protein n=1 Tax=Herbaspirillum lusitanum TaxID=213312 RepID=A0ABW9A3Q1_9BURK
MNPSSLTPSSIDRRIALSRTLLSELARRAPLRLLVQTLFEWLCIVLMIVAAVRVAHPLFSTLCILLIATRQHALLALMHEYAHYQLSRRQAWLNDLVGDVFTAFPFFISVFGFRRNHMQHHRNTSSGQDPNWMSSLRKQRYQFPMSKPRYLSEVIKHCVGWYTFAELKGYTVDAGMALELPRFTRIARVLFTVLAVLAISALGWWPEVLLYWVLPMSTFLMAILYVRDVGEHFGMPSQGFGHSRTVVAGWLERLLISQNGVHFHAEHHLFPSVPFFRLRRLHRILLSDQEYQVRAVITRGYFGQLLDEISRPGAGGQQSGDRSGGKRTAGKRMETRYLQRQDVPALLELEQSKWEPNQAADAQTLQDRIRAFPTLSMACFCLDTGKALASLFLRPVSPAIFTAPTRWEYTADASAWPYLDGATTRSLFGISLSSNRADAVDDMFRFFYSRALKAGWTDVFLGSPMPGFRKARERDPQLSVWRYVHAKRTFHSQEPLDPQLRYYFRKGFRQIVSVHENYFPHDASLDYGVILRGHLPLSTSKRLWRIVPLFLIESFASLILGGAR